MSITRGDIPECRFSWAVVSPNRLYAVSQHARNEFEMQHRPDDKTEANNKNMTIIDNMTKTKRTYHDVGK